MAEESAASQAVRRQLATDFPGYAETCLKIRPKPGKIIPFLLNATQWKVHRAVEEQLERTGRVRAVILKGRQQGCSTYVEGRFFWKVSHRTGVKAFILTHRTDATETIYGMAERFYEHCPDCVRPHRGAGTAKGMTFDILDSGYRVGTAGSEDVGRSDTVQYFHGSEVAYWPNAAAHVGGALETVPTADGTEIILESTANGIGGLFHQKYWDAEQGKGDYTPIFIPWFLHDEYRRKPEPGWKPPLAWAEYGKLHKLDELQVCWAYTKNLDLAASVGTDADEISWKFREVYPGTAAEAFQSGEHDSFIRPELVIAAMKAKAPDQTHLPLIFGIDTARAGGDKWHIIDRRGRCAGHLVNDAFECHDEMEAAGRIALLIDKHKPDAVFMDVTGGYGAGAYDRLRERGYRSIVHGIEFGSKAADGRQYANKRAEIWGRMRDWLGDPGGADILDDNTLHAHICAPGFTFTSNDQIRLEKKTEIRKRTDFSPDGGDALALTFAEHVRREAMSHVYRPSRANAEYRVLG